MRGSSVKSCLFCDKEFKTYNCRVGKYCSRACTSRANIKNPHVILKCNFCGKDYPTFQSQIKWHGSKYCSRKCKDKSKIKKDGDKVTPRHEFKTNGRKKLVGGKWTTKYADKIFSEFIRARDEELERRARTFKNRVDAVLEVMQLLK